MREYRPLLIFVSTIVFAIIALRIIFAPTLVGDERASASLFTFFGYVVSLCGIGWIE